ncbi:MAG: glucose-6-phosphate isomerase [Pseudomonadota bacterium]
MTHGLYTQTIDTAFEDAVGVHGANRGRYDFWRASLAAAQPGLLANPPREAAPILALPTRSDDLAEIDAIAAHIAGRFSTLVVVGMGGSSLSGEALASIRAPGLLTLRFVDNIDPHSFTALLDSLVWRDTAFLVISKSGNTVETLAALGVFLAHARRAVADYAAHFFVITIPNDNPLHRLATTHGFRLLAHDVDLGGRFSILSAVGLIPAAAIGLDIRALRAGAAAVRAQDAAESAALHLALSEKQVSIQVLMHYCDRLGGFAGWFRQCWGESLGKCDRASTLVPSRGVTDQHSQLQLYLDGPKDKLFTALIVEESKGQGPVIEFPGETDARLAYLVGHTLGDLLMAEQLATNTTLIQSGAPLRSFAIPKLNEMTLGALLMHGSLEIMFTAHLLGINAFDQPAVEASKLLALAHLRAAR